MAEIFKTYGEDIILWRNYFGVRVLEPKVTEFGSYDKKICLSIGQQLKTKAEIEKALDNATEETREKIKRLAPSHALTGFTKEEKKGFFKRLKGSLMGAYKKVGKFLGVEFAGEEPLELYHYVKFSDVEDYMSVFSGVGLGFGALCKINNISQNDMERKLRKWFKYIMSNAKRGWKKG